MVIEDYVLHFLLNLGGFMSKLLFLVLAAFLSSCALYELRPGEYDIEECECAEETDGFKSFMKRDTENP